MKPPTKIVHIAPYRYRIHMDEKLSEVANVTGACMSDSERILLDANCGGNVVRETLLHECLHALFHAAWGEKSGMENEEQERVISGISPRLLEFLRNNPELVSWMQEES